jgi:hypothetical protein
MGITNTQQGVITEAEFAKIVMLTSANWSQPELSPMMSAATSKSTSVGTFEKVWRRKSRRQNAGGSTAAPTYCKSTSESRRQS